MASLIAALLAAWATGFCLAWKVRAIGDALRAA